MTLDELKKEAKKDMKISMNTMEHDSMKTPQIHHKYIKELEMAKSLYDKYTLDMRELKLNKWLYYSGKADPKIYDENPLDLKIMKTDVKMFIEGDKEILDLEHKIKFINRKIDFIEDTISECNRRSFHITNMRKSLKFKHGEFD